MFEKLNSLEISEYLGTMQNLLEQGVAVGIFHTPK